MRYQTLMLLMASLTALPPRVAHAQDSAASALALDSLLKIKVSASAKYAQTVAEAASSVTIITSEDIERYGYRTLEDVVNTVAGFYTSNDRTYTYIGTRGFSRPSDYNNRVLLLLDGNTMNEGVWGSAPIGTELGVPLRALERIEIVRGPGSVLYGTGAMFAVINLVTKSAGALDRPEVGVEVGTYGRRGASMFVGREFRGGTEVTLGGSLTSVDGTDLYFPEFDTPENNHGIAHHLDWRREWSLIGSASRGPWTLRARYSSRVKAIPTASFGYAFNTNPFKTEDNWGYAELGYARDLGAAWHLSTRTYINHYQYLGWYAGPPEGGTSMVLGGETVGRWDMTSADRLTMGAEFRRNTAARYYYPVDAPTFDLSDPYSVLSFYAQQEHQFTRSLMALIGVRYDYYTTTGAAVTPRGALIYSPSSTTAVKLLYGHAFRAPNIYENQVESELYIRNPDLTREKDQTTELLWYQRLSPRLLGTVSLYHYTADGLIDLINLTEEDRYQYRNLADTRATGAEVALNARGRNGLSGYASYAYQSVKDRATNQRLTNSPAHSVKAGVGFQPLGWLRPAVETRYESSRRTVYDTKTDPYALLNLHLLFTVRSFDLSLRVNNLFNTPYAVPGGAEHVQPAIAQDGRNLLAELRHRF